MVVAADLVEAAALHAAATMLDKDSEGEGMPAAGVMLPQADKRETIAQAVASAVSALSALASAVGRTMASAVGRTMAPKLRKPAARQKDAAADSGHFSAARQRHRMGEK